MNEANGVKARHSSASVEHYTPPEIVEAARATMGGIDLDPFSCPTANKTVRAHSFFSDPLAPGAEALSVGGFDRDWYDRVFCNPPGSKDPDSKNESNQKRAWFKLASEYDSGRVTQAIFIAFSLELFQTTQIKVPGYLKIPLQFPICYARKRVAYMHPNDDGSVSVGASPPHSSAIVYLPPPSSDPLCVRPGVHAFRLHFASIGHVVVPT